MDGGKYRENFKILGTARNIFCPASFAVTIMRSDHEEHFLIQESRAMPNQRLISRGKDSRNKNEIKTRKEKKKRDFFPLKYSRGTI